MALAAWASWYPLSNWAPSECLTLGHEAVVGGLYKVDSVLPLWHI